MTKSETKIEKKEGKYTKTVTTEISMSEEELQKEKEQYLTHQKNAQNLVDFYQEKIDEIDNILTLKE